MYFCKKNCAVIKTLYAILLLATIAVKPLSTVAYVVYYELNVDYIIEKYCVNKSKPKLKCNGKCHLSKQLAFSATDTSSDKHPKTYSVIEALSPLFFAKQTSYIFAWNSIDITPQNWFYTLKTYISFLSVKLQPPRSL